MSRARGVPKRGKQNRIASARDLIRMGAWCGTARYMLCSLLFSTVVASAASAQVPSGSLRTGSADQSRLILRAPYQFPPRAVVPARPVGVTMTYARRSSALAAIRSSFGAGDDEGSITTFVARPRRDAPKRTFTHDGVMTVSGWRTR